MSLICKSCRRRVRPELLDKTLLRHECKKDPAAKWLADRTPEKTAPTDAPAKQKQGIRRRKQQVPCGLQPVQPDPCLDGARPPDGPAF